jgi:hypothetical protein
MGGNRGGKNRQYTNLLATMVIGGVWHGAGWTFILWGMAHGCLLVVNHMIKPFISPPKWLKVSIGRFGLFLILTLIWILFRSSDLDQVTTMILAMMGEAEGTINLIKPKNWGPVLGLLLMTLYAPNIYQLMSYYQPALGVEQYLFGWSKQYKLNNKYAVILAIAFVLCLFSLSQISEFLYYQF